MISIPVATNNIAFRNQLSIFWENHKSIYGDDAYKKAHAIIVSQNHPEQKQIEHGEWGLDIPSTVVEPYWSYLQIDNLDLLLPINIQVGLSQIIENFEDNEILELIDCDMFHVKEYEEQEVGENEFLVCDIYENWHLKSKGDSYRVVENFLDKSQSDYNGGFVPIIGQVKTFKKILRYWTDMHLRVFNSADGELTKWWSGMYSFQVACANNGINMKAIDSCYVPGINELKGNHHIAHYCCDTIFDKKKELEKTDKFDYTGFPNNYFYNQVKDWMKKMNTIKHEGEIKYELPEPLVKKPFYVDSFFTTEMFERVKEKINSLGMGTEENLQYHTMIGRWEASVAFDEDIEQFCLGRAREYFNNDNLQKAYFFTCRYQIRDGCIPHLWEHTDQNGTQTSIDVAIENTADWDLIVERERFKQPENSAVIFAGQQHMHARPFYPTNDESLFTTVLFLHFTDPDHWYQKDSRLIATYGKDGDIRYLNRNGFIPYPDPPLDQPVCSCHDYSNVIGLYDLIYGNHFNDEVQLVDMEILSEEILAPGIVKYTTSEESARLMKGLTQNFAKYLWEPAQVLVGKDNKPGLDYDSRKCYALFFYGDKEKCHPWDPATRVMISLEKGIGNAIAKYSSRYAVKKTHSSHTMLLRYEQNNHFHNHYDDCKEYPRTVSASYIMNDDFLGGDLSFPEFDLTVKPKAGEIIVFPSSYVYMHSVKPVEFGIRYAAVKWYQWD